jgi:hypothetical protein
MELVRQEFLLKTELSKIFSNGYYVALPDRNFGFAIAKDVTEKELKQTKTLVKKMYKVATSPMSPACMPLSILICHLSGLHRSMTIIHNY